MFSTGLEFRCSVDNQIDLVCLSELKFSSEEVNNLEEGMPAKSGTVKNKSSETPVQIEQVKELLGLAAAKLKTMDEPLREISWLVEGILEQVENTQAEGQPLPNKRHVKVLDDLEDQLEREANSSAS